MTLSIVAHLLGFSELVEESDDLVLESWFCGGSCLEVDAREERGSYTLWRQGFVEEDLATLGFVLITLSLYLYWYRPICGLLYLLL